MKQLMWASNTIHRRTDHNGSKRTIAVKAMNTRGTPVAYDECLRNKVKLAIFADLCELELKVKTANCERLVGINFHTQ